MGTQKTINKRKAGGVGAEAGVPPPPYSRPSHCA